MTEILARDLSWLQVISVKLSRPLSQSDSYLNKSYKQENLEYLITLQTQGIKLDDDQDCYWKRSTPCKKRDTRNNWSLASTNIFTSFIRRELIWYLDSKNAEKLSADPMQFMNNKHHILINWYLNLILTSLMYFTFPCKSRLFRKQAKFITNDLNIRILSII